MLVAVLGHRREKKSEQWGSEGWKYEVKGSFFVSRNHWGSWSRKCTQPELGFR